jgi:hypothetical protein
VPDIEVDQEVSRRRRDASGQFEPMRCRAVEELATVAGQRGRDDKSELVDEAGPK